MNIFGSQISQNAISAVFVQTSPKKRNISNRNKASNGPKCNPHISNKVLTKHKYTLCSNCKYCVDPACTGVRLSKDILSKLTTFKDKDPTYNNFKCNLSIIIKC